jgi:hypothetical protein
MNKIRQKRKCISLIHFCGNIGDYDSYKCVGSNCPVCELENPSCEGLPDGKNAFLGREQTSWYIECRKERTVNRMTCPGSNNFDPINRRCLGEENISKFQCCFHLLPVEHKKFSRFIGNQKSMKRLHIQTLHHTVSAFLIQDPLCSQKRFLMTLKK